MEPNPPIPAERAGGNGSFNERVNADTRTLSLVCRISHIHYWALFGIYLAVQMRCNLSETYRSVSTNTRLREEVGVVNGRRHNDLPARQVDT